MIILGTIQCGYCTVTSQIDTGKGDWSRSSCHAHFGTEKRNRAEKITVLYTQQAQQTNGGLTRDKRRHRKQPHKYLSGHFEFFVKWVWTNRIAASRSLNFCSSWARHWTVDNETIAQENLDCVLWALCSERAERARLNSRFFKSCPVRPSSAANLDWCMGRSIECVCDGVSVTLWYMVAWRGLHHDVVLHSRDHVAWSWQESKNKLWALGVAPANAARAGTVLCTLEKNECCTTQTKKLASLVNYVTRSVVGEKISKCARDVLIFNENTGH